MDFQGSHRQEHLNLQWLLKVLSANPVWRKLRQALKWALR